MTREEIIATYGVELNAIERFHKTGLVTPKRMEDGTLVYSDAEGEMFQRLLLLEKMGLSENDFIGLRSGEKTLEALLQRQINRLEDGCLGKEICRGILEEGADLHRFDAKKYLAQMGTDATEHIFSFNRSFRNQVFRPWRRYFARGIDASIYCLLWEAFLGYVCHVNLSDEGFLLEVVGIVMTTVMMILIEPLLLNRFGTTFGKWIFGLRIEKADESPISYAEGLKRTWVIVGKGYGYYIPIYSLVRLYKSYKLCKTKEMQPWDEGFAYTIKDTKWYRVAACIVLNVIVIIIAIVLILAQLLPPNRGDITVEQFAENYNYYCKYIEANEGWYMDENGKLTEEDSDGTASTDILDEEDPMIEINSDGTLSMNVPAEERPSFKYEIEGGYLTGVSFLYEVENKDHWTNIESTEGFLIALAFGCADSELTDFVSDMKSVIMKMITDEEFDFTVGSSRYFCDVEREGYDDHSFMTPMEGVQRAYYKMEFSVTKVK
ncbi:MAG: RDD family protein [Anaerotignum sp.]|nr:RDD family protein [Anaerotignum sp.]